MPRTPPQTALSKLSPNGYPTSQSSLMPSARSSRRSSKLTLTKFDLAKSTDSHNLSLMLSKIPTKNPSYNCKKLHEICTSFPYFPIKESRTQKIVFFLKILQKTNIFPPKTHISTLFYVVLAFQIITVNVDQVIAVSVGIFL